MTGRLLQQANNGRVALRDAYEEALGLVQYLRQEVAELGERKRLER